MAEDREYYPFLDVIRVFACWLVILLHLCSMRFHAFSAEWAIYMSYEAVSRICVPLFFMLTGFLLLDGAGRNPIRFYRKRYTRILLPFAVICAIYYFTPEYENFTPLQFTEKIVLSYVDFHLWYVYALLGIYLLLPFFSAWTASPNGAKLNMIFVIFWLVLIVFLYNLCTYFYPGIKILDHYHLNFLATYMGYVIFGWFIKKKWRHFDNKVHAAALAIFLLCTAATILSTWHLSHLKGKPDEFFFGNFTPFVCFASISFFILATKFSHISPFMRDLSDKTYWIYLLHLLILRYFIFLFPIPANMTVILLLPIYTTFIFMFCYLVAIPLRKAENIILRSALPQPISP